MTTATRPTIWQRINPFNRPQRAIDLYGGERNDLLSEQVGTPEARRMLRRNEDIIALYGAVFAAIRRRSRAVAKPSICLVRKQGGEEVEVEDHPALLAINRVNESLTRSQGFGLIEQHKLTHGAAYWVKRRNGLGVPVEFEIWPPSQVRPVPDKNKPWVPAYFERRLAIGKVEQVAPKDVVWFRHMVDPRDPMRGLSPIGAVRAEIDTGIEAQRFNQRYFDNAIHLGRMFTAEDAGQGEVDRIEQDLERKFKGTDRAHRSMVLGGNLKILETKPPHKDMEFLSMQQWGVEEVARVFEMAPELLGLGSRTYENAPEAERSFWRMIVDQVDATLDEFNEFYLWPDFGEEFRFVARYDGIEALQVNQKQRAEVDEIYLRTGKTFINELRQRDGEDVVRWGDTPIMPANVAPLGSVPMTSKVPAPMLASARSVAGREASMRQGWERRFSGEAKALSDYFAAADARAVEIADVDGYNWDWWTKYGAEVVREFELVYGAVLADAGFIETPLLPAQEIASRWARERGAELLRLEGRLNIVAYTRAWVRGLVGQTIEQGQSLQTLQKNLRTGFGFSRSRAEMIARTETANAQTKGSLASYQSQGTEGKEWLTSGDERVCEICLGNEGDGPIPVGSPFSSGDMGPAAHPRDRCTLLPVRELGRG